MAKYFLESSAFTKRYKREQGTDFVDNLFGGSHELFYLNLAIVEVRKVFYRLWKYPQTIENDAQITEDEFNELVSRFAADLQQLQRIEFTEEMILRISSILERGWVKSVFDLAQLSSYLITREEHPDILFVCSDKSNLIEITKLFVPEKDIVIPENQ